MSDNVRVVRVIIYEGKLERVQGVLNNSLRPGVFRQGKDLTMTVLPTLKQSDKISEMLKDLEIIEPKAGDIHGTYHVIRTEEARKALGRWQMLERPLKATCTHENMTRRFCPDCGGQNPMFV